jgi:hypothetical protein
VLFTFLLLRPQTSAQYLYIHTYSLSTTMSLRCSLASASGWMEHVARMGEIRNAYKILVGNRLRNREFAKTKQLCQPLDREVRRSVRISAGLPASGRRLFVIFLAFSPKLKKDDDRFHPNSCPLTIHNIFFSILFDARTDVVETPLSINVRISQYVSPLN